MGRIFYVMGKSASGKDTIFKRIHAAAPELRTVVTYTTRPIRDEEQDGVEYYFTTREELEELERQGKVVELRTYRTAQGPWSYATVDDGQIDLDRFDYLMIGTLESFGRMKDYFGGGRIVPIYVEVEDGERLCRALSREKAQREPKYAELCRRFLADDEDFSEEKLKLAGIRKRYDNAESGSCAREILDDIAEYSSEWRLCPPVAEP